MMANNEVQKGINGVTTAKESRKIIVYLPDNLGGVDMIRQAVIDKLRNEDRLLDALKFHKETKDIENEGLLYDIARKYVKFD